MLRLPDAWVWDFWIADTGGEYHLFFLRASRAFIDPDRRHNHSSVGHAVSTDLRTWTLRADALVPSDGPAWDDFTIWTGSVLRGTDGRWRMFYTGRSRAEGGTVQRIGVAVSNDLDVWSRRPGPAVTLDPTWYDERDAGGQQHWRDPWVFADPAGDGWHMLITARAGGAGAIGHAWSPDLERWEVRPPMTTPGRFGEVEVPQAVVVDGQPVLVFSCPDEERNVGTWWLPCDELAGPYDLTLARPLVDASLYSARLVRGRDGRWVALAFGRAPFDGVITDPIDLPPSA